ncbi:MAG: hypothetical protein H7098_07405 [Oligoflexus sp.]|nr:hypothetical protein [Pseudopedobacter sp.]
MTIYLLGYLGTFVLSFFFTIYCKFIKLYKHRSNIVSEEEKKVKQFMIYSDFEVFLERIGHDKYKYSNLYVLAPESSYKRETMIGLISKAFTQFLSKTDITKN